MPRAYLREATRPLADELGVSIGGDLAHDEQVAGFSGGAVLASELAALDHAGYQPDVALRAAFCGTDQFGAPRSIVGSAARESVETRRRGTDHENAFHRVCLLIGGC